jgi:hypothetical protein
LLGVQRYFEIDTYTDYSALALDPDGKAVG